MTWRDELDAINRLAEQPISEDNFTSEERLEDLAWFCYNLHYTPSQYWELTTEERVAIVRYANRVNKK